MAIKINGDNTVANPGFSGDDTDTGLQVGTNELKLVTGGTQRVVVASSGNVGVGVASPSQKLHIQGTGTTRMQITGGSSATARINFGDTDDEDIGMIIYDNASNSLQLVTNVQERLRITSDGKVGIGESSPSEALHVKGGTVCKLTLESTSSTGTSGVQFGDPQDDNVGRIQYEHNGNYMQFEVNAAEAMRITSAGVVTAKKGAVAEIDTLTSGTTITPDFAASCNFTVTLGHNATIANPSNLTAGQSGSIFLVQDGTGSRTASWGSYWDWAGGVAPTLTSSANGVDRIDYIVRSSTSIHAVATLNLS